MRTRSLKVNIQLSFLAIIVVLAFATAFFAYYQINKRIIDTAQRQVVSDLKIARWVYEAGIEEIKTAFNLVDVSYDKEKLKKEIGLDYLYVIDARGKASVKSEVVLAAFEGKPAAGTRIIGKEELAEMGPSFVERSVIEVRPTPKARPTPRKVLESAMAIGYAKPIFDAEGRVISVMYGGRIINRDFALVDKIRGFVFENRLYDGKPVGTVTIFLDDVRIATNVLDQEGQRAIGTRVSDTVYDKVVGEGRSWLTRAFVVTDWYLTAYEPIRNIEGKVIGILYVGVLEKPFVDMRRNMFFVFVAIVALASVLAAVLSLILANAVSRPVTRLLKATSKFSSGDLDFRVDTTTSMQELDILARSFNEMASKLDERGKTLEVANSKLAALNKSYLDLIGFVAHELKAILSSTVLNAYTLRDGFLGMVNFKQRKALDSITRNLDYLSSTVRNFLDLSRIEKGEMVVRPRDLLIKEDIIDVSVEAFSKPAAEKEMTLVNRAGPGLRVKGDPDLLLIVFNNLIGNAVKYGSGKGRIEVGAQASDGILRVEVYNDGPPITDEQKEKLFRKFSRLQAPGIQKVTGTGLGLFITKEIIEKHRGRIWAEAKSAGNVFIFEIERGL